MAASRTTAAFEDVTGMTPAVRKDAPLLGQLVPHDQVRAVNFLADHAAVYAIDPVRYLAGDGLLAGRLLGTYSRALLREVVKSVLAARPDWLCRDISDVKAGAEARRWAAATHASAAEQAAAAKDWPAAVEALCQAVLIDPDHVVVREISAENLLARLVERIGS